MGLVAFCHVEAVVVTLGKERLVTSCSGELSSGSLGEVCQGVSS